MIRQGRKVGESKERERKVKKGEKKGTQVLRREILRREINMCLVVGDGLMGDLRKEKKRKGRSREATFSCGINEAEEHTTHGTAPNRGDCKHHC